MVDLLLKFSSGRHCGTNLVRPEAVCVDTEVDVVKVYQLVKVFATVGTW